MNAIPERRLFFTELATAIAPPEPLPLSQWLAQNLVLVDGPFSGQLWTADGAPYLSEIADCLGEDHPCNLVTVRKAQQTGASILALGWCLYIAEREPANTLFAVPGIDALRDMNAAKMQPLIDAWQKRIGRQIIVPQTSRQASGSTTYEKVFPGGRIWLANANSIMDLSSKTARRGVKDELSKWEVLDNGADPETLYHGRFTAFRRLKTYKILEISTPEVDAGENEDATESIEGHCRIDRSFRKSDRRFWNCVCPECQRLFVHHFDRFVVDKDHPHKSHYPCFCGHKISETERVGAVRAGKWIAQIDDDATRHPGFHIDAFISLMMSYEAIAEDWIKAQKTEKDRKDFSNLVLGLPYKYVGDAPDHVRLMALREKYDRRRIPPQGILLTAAADVQANGIYVEIVAWGHDRQSWVIEALVLDGDTSDPDAGAFKKLAEVYDTPWPDSYGGARRVDAFGVDSGFRANVVYTWCRGRSGAFALKGIDGWHRPSLGTPSLVDIDLGGKKLSKGASVWGVGTWPLKAQVFADLRKKRRQEGEEREPAGAAHFADWIDEPYLVQLTNEYMHYEPRRGRTARVWKQRGPNHFLDCRVYNLALADYLGLNRLTREEWKQLARLRGITLEVEQMDIFGTEVMPVPAAGASDADTPDKPPPPPAPAPPAPRQRLSSRSSFM